LHFFFLALSAECLFFFFLHFLFLAGVCGVEAEGMFVGSKTAVTFRR